MSLPLPASSFSIPTGTAHIVFATESLEHGATIAKVYFSDPAPHGMAMTLNITVGFTRSCSREPEEETNGAVSASGSSSAL